MSLYSIAVFVHVVGALLLFALLSLEGFTLRTGMAAARLNRVLGPVTALAILVPGLYMAATGPGWTGWVVTGIVTYVLIAALGTYTGISVLRGRLGRGPATVSWLLRVGMATGVVFDMTVKPGAVGSVVAVVAAAVLALLALPALRAARAT